MSSNSIIPGVQGDGSLFNKTGLIKRNLSGDLNQGLKNPFHYLDVAGLSVNADIADGITNAREALVQADSEGPIILPPGIYTVNSNLTLSNKVTFLPGAKLKPANEVVITLSDGYVANDEQHVFDISAGGTITLTKKIPVYPEHWGARVANPGDPFFDSTLFVQAAINATRNVRFLSGQYICTVTCDPDNGSVLLEGNNTWLTAAASNQFALTLSGEYASGVCRISNITFYGDNPQHGADPGRTKHGLLINVASNVFLDNCWFQFCDLGLVTQLTIITTYSNLVFNQCRVGIYYTARTASTSTLTITTPLGQTFNLPDPLYGVGHPAEQLLIGPRMTLCDIGFVVDSPGNEWSPSRDFKIDKPLFQYCKIGMLLLPDVGPTADSTFINNPWFEGQNVTTSVSFNGVTYQGCDVYISGMQAIQNGGWISSIRARTTANYRLENASWTTSGDSNFDLFDVQDKASVTGELVNAINRIPFRVRAGIPTQYSQGPIFECSPMISKGYTLKDDSKLLFSKSCETGDLPTAFFGGTSLGVINDGPSDANESLGFLATAGNGVLFGSTFVGIPVTQYVAKFAIKAYCPIRTFTVDPGTDIFTSTSHGFVNNMEVRLFTTTTLPTGTALNTSYYIIDASTDTFKLSTTVGGSSINVENIGTGTHTIQQITEFNLRTQNVGSGAFIGTINLPTTTTWKTWCINGITPSSVTDSSFFIGGSTSTVVRAFLIAQMYMVKVDNFADSLLLIDSQQFYSNNYIESSGYIDGPKDKAEAISSSSTPTFDYTDYDGDTKTHTQTSLITPVITMNRPGRHDLLITQDLVGYHEILWPTNMKFRYLPPQPDPLPGKKSLLSWVYDGTHGVADGIKHSYNFVADFDAVPAYGTTPTITFPNAGTILIKIRLNEETPSGSKTRLINPSDSHYPHTNSLAYLDILRSTRVDAITLSSSIDREEWHWLIIRTSSGDGWQALQANLDGILYSVSTASHLTLTTQSYLIGSANCQAEVDRWLIFNSRLNDANCQAVIASDKTISNTSLPSGLLARYEMNYDRGTKIIQDWSGNGRDIPMTNITPSLFVINSGTN
jgi:hypothetical protein